MSRIITKESLASLSNEELLGLIKDHGVSLNMYDGQMNEGRIKDLVGTDIYNAKLIDYTGLQFMRQAIKNIEVLDDDDCPQLLS